MIEIISQEVAIVLNKKRRSYERLDFNFAERKGFEPSVQLPVRILSRDVVSATHPSHRNVRP